MEGSRPGMHRIALERSQARLERARAALDQPSSNALDPHCAEHAYYHASCGDCERARAAFQPYQTKGKVESSRSFQGSSAAIVVEPSLTWKDVAAIAVVDTAADSAADAVRSLIYGLLP